MTRSCLIAACTALAVGLLFEATIGTGAAVTTWAALALLGLSGAPLILVVAAVAAGFSCIAVRFGLAAWRVETAADG